MSGPMAALNLRRPASLFLLLSLAIVSAGCASAVGGNQASGAGATGADSLTGDEIRESGEENLYLALSRLRPQWLRARGRASLTFEQSTTPIVYLFGIQHGPVNTLSAMNVNDVQGVESMSPADATTRFGTGHSGGVIFVDLVRVGR